MATIEHAFVEQNTEQTTVSASYVDVSGASLASGNFTAGKKYLIYVTALGSEDSSGSVGVQVMHGSTAFAESTMLLAVTGSYSVYGFFTVWTAIASEGIKLQFKVSAGTGYLDQIAIHTMNLSDNLVENTDWFFNERATDDSLSTSHLNGGTVTFTPGTAGQDWLVCSFANVLMTDAAVSAISRLERSGEASSTLPETRIMRGTTNTPFLQMRPFNLGNASNTFTEVSFATGTAHERKHSSIFALNLNKFKVYATAYTEADLALGITNYGNQLQTTSITPTVTGDVWILTYWGFDFGSSSRTAKSRIQVDNTDSPSGQTTDAHTIRFATTDNSDEDPISMQTVLSLSNAAHTIDLDGSTSSVSNAPAAQQRSIVALTMQLATVATVFPAAVGSYLATGVAAVLRIGSFTILEHRR